MTEAPLPKEKLSPVMQACVDFMRGQGGYLYRHPGGFWGAMAFRLHESFGTSTVEALVRRGVAEYVHWRESERGGRRFPITASLKGPPT